MKTIRRLFLACLLLTATAAAQAQFSGTGAGTQASPCMITKALPLDGGRNNLAAFDRLGNNMSLTAYLSSGGAGDTQWTTAGGLPFATRRNPLDGHFDRAGYRISGLWMNRTGLDGVGLFARIDGNASHKEIKYQLNIKNQVL